MRTAGVPGRGLLPINVHRGISLCLFVHALAHQPVFRGNEYDASFAKNASVSRRHVSPVNEHADCR